MDLPRSLRADVQKKSAHASEQNRPDILKRREDWFDGQLDLDPQFDLLACKNRLLPIKRQAVGVLRNVDAGQKPLGRDAARDQAGGRGRLDDVLAASLAGISGTTRHDHPELRRDDIEAFAEVLANLHPVAGAQGQGWSPGSIITSARSRYAGSGRRPPDLHAGVGRSFCSMASTAPRPVCTSSKVKAYWL